MQISILFFKKIINHDLVVFITICSACAIGKVSGSPGRREIMLLALPQLQYPVTLYEPYCLIIYNQKNINMASNIFY